MAIDKTAVIAPGATLGADVKIGPYCMVGGDVKLGDRVELVSHVVIDGKTEIGDDTIIYPFASIGTKGQDLKYQRDEDQTGLKIGRLCRIREYVTIQSGTPASPNGTIIGDDTQVMINAHVAHDCKIGNHVVLSNLAQIAGHVEIGDHAIISGMAAVHQFCHIGEYAFLGAMSGTPVDIPPYTIYEGAPARYRSINKVGLARHGFTNEDMHAIYTVYTAVLDGNSTEELSARIAKVRKLVRGNRYAENALDFIEHRSDRGIIAGAKLNFKKD
ncbi:MAG: acyl-ACP--UDP-N-acetylglucosamine O-acyltransferase [Rickettsiales bacterium]|jgi:UDP-N-acetylglucosamine acyltransferase|nr:acyl-ACP--UDP-N-acetylglucosamine O-acyltransferase [Rickettsiales bacterium]